MYVFNKGFYNFHDNAIHMYARKETVATTGVDKRLSKANPADNRIKLQKYAYTYVHKNCSIGRL